VTDHIKAFIIPRGRTGGTLFATMINAHPLMTFGYEIYPDKLEADGRDSFKVQTAIDLMEDSQDENPEIWINQLSPGNFRTFCARARRSGLDMPILLEELKKFCKAGKNFDDIHGRLDFIDSLIETQRLKNGKQYAGSKMRVDPYLLFERHPNTSFYMMLRDGRDVLDSRLNVGNFKTNAEECARDWMTSLVDFEKFLKDTGARGCLVKYEELVYEPEKTLTSALSHADLEYHPNMLNYLKSNPTLLNTPHGHLSATQIAEGLNDRSVSRWKNGLSKHDLEIFLNIAGSVLVRYGYTSD